jgi:SAM-dependent methyltransferase
VPRGAADLVISSDVLHHVRSTPMVVRNVRATLRTEGRWSIVEPNPGNPYVGLYQALTRGERNFWTRRFLRQADAAGLVVTARGRMFLIPAAIEDPPGWLLELESRLEGAPVLGGAVTLELTAA